VVGRADAVTIGRPHFRCRACSAAAHDHQEGIACGRFGLTVPASLPFDVIDAGEGGRYLAVSVVTIRGMPDVPVTHTVPSGATDT
jgi:hypothetical protein